MLSRSSSQGLYKYIPGGYRYRYTYHIQVSSRVDRVRSSNHTPPARLLLCASIAFGRAVNKPRFHHGRSSISCCRDPKCLWSRGTRRSFSRGKTRMSCDRSLLYHTVLCCCSLALGYATARRKERAPKLRRGWIICKEAVLPALLEGC